MERQPFRTATERELGLLRANEARSTGTTEQRLCELAIDPMRPVRLWTARNPNTPPGALDVLIQDEDHSVRNSALFHPRTPAAALERAAQQEADEAEAVRHLVAHHPTRRHNCAIS
ncbi:hypothetical protein ACIA8K_40950 [Catenuloplanes sp. NPDC051500]|uniref:hypothetical protein n=1 Tax=Catenuloplanes sp. NPDC051500 TaxID=3363959 RepID=UPI0037BD7D2C